MKHKLLAIVITMLCVSTTRVLAQERVVQNRPYTDLRPFHFGIFAGFHLQDLEFNNVGTQVITLEDGTTTEALVTCDQDRWDEGFNVGVLGEFRINRDFQFRVAPAMYFGTRHITFHNFKTPEDEQQTTLNQVQNLKTAYISSAFDIIFAAHRMNNHRPYVIAGINPMINLSGKDNAYLKLRRTDVFLEAGVGCDFYLPYFKLRPELKFLYGLTNCLDKDHIQQLRDFNMRQYAGAGDKARSKMIVLTFYFE